MTSSYRYKTLLRRYEAKNKSCDMKFMLCKKNESQLIQTQHTFLVRRHSISVLIESLRYTGVTNLNGIFKQQRSVSVLRRQLVDLAVEEAALAENLQTCLIEQQTLLQQRALLLRKLERYRYLLQLEQRSQRLQALKREEIETEEIITWKR